MRLGGGVVLAGVEELEHEVFGRVFAHRRPPPLLFAGARVYDSNLIWMSIDDKHSDSFNKNHYTHGPW